MRYNPQFGSKTDLICAENDISLYQQLLVKFTIHLQQNKPEIYSTIKEISRNHTIANKNILTEVLVSSVQTLNYMK
jgi:hypothetical protein